MFDDSYDARPADVEPVLEAARWAPAVGNSQPWVFLTAHRGDAVHPRVLRHLAPSSARWAPTAGLLVVNLCHRYVEGTDWEYSEFALHDLGQAVARMTVQAQSRGLSARQFRASDAAGLAAEFDVPGHWQITSMTAFGRLPRQLAEPAPSAPGAGESRQRRAVPDISWPPGPPG